MYTLRFLCCSIVTIGILAICPDCPELEDSERAALSDCRNKLENAKQLQWHDGDPCRAVTYGDADEPWGINPCVESENSENCYFSCAIFDDPTVEYDAADPWKNKKTHIIDINLPFQGLGGPLCTEFGLLRKLKRLDFTGNKLSGNLPNSMGQSTDLATLKLSGNQFGGSIPESWSELNITMFAINNNQDMCGSEWLGAIAKPKENGSEALLLAINAGGGYAATKIGIDCASLDVQEEIKFLQVMWTAGFAVVAMLFSGWALGTG